MVYGKGEKYMINQKKLYSIALVSTAMILMLTNITGAAPFAYITGWDGNVSVIDTSTNNVTVIIPLKDYYGGVAVAPDGTNVCVANNSNKGTVAVINTATNNVTSTLNVKENPIAFEQFIAPIPINPTLTIATSASSTSYNVAGQNIIYTYTVTNSENVDISGNITVTDNRTGQIFIPNTNLAPGKSITGTATYVIKQADLDAGSVTNSAYARNNNTNSNTAILTVLALQNSALMVVKSAFPANYSTIGQTITYIYTVTNSGNVNVNGPINIVDSLITGLISIYNKDLGPGQNITGLATYTITHNLWKSIEKSSAKCDFFSA